MLSAPNGDLGHQLFSKCAPPIFRISAAIPYEHFCITVARACVARCRLPPPAPSMGSPSGARACLEDFLGFSPFRFPDFPRRPKRPPRSPKDGPRGLQEGPKAAQESSKTARESPKTAQESPKTVQEAPKTAPDAPKTASRRPKRAPRRPRTPPRRPKRPPRRPKSLKICKNRLKSFKIAWFQV